MALSIVATSPLALSLFRLPTWRLGAQPAVPLSRKDAALLALLALEGACSRDVLAQMLWPEADVAKARASLRQRRHRLARSAGMALIEGEATLQLAAGVDYDARDPEAQLARDAAALPGELLDGLVFDDCPEYARWLDGARVRWRMTRAQALGRLASRLQEQGGLGRAIAVAQRLCAEEPLSEHAHRQLMELHYAHGDLGAALQVYQRLAERLEAELGELPDEETAALAARLRLGQAPVRAATAAGTSVPPTLRRPPRLIGREAAWAALEQACAGRAAVVVEGAPGVGKTRLVTDFVAGCQAGAALMVPARAGDAQRPYALLVRLLSRLWLDAEALRPGGQQALPEWARHELAALLPELGTGTPRMEALRLQRAVEVALQQAKLELVALDDVQNADAATLELLASWVGEGLPAWVVACRAGELPSPVITWLQASEAPQQVALQPLGAAEIEALLQDLALPGFEVRDWAHMLARHTGGLPLFVLETLRVLLEQPAETRRDLPLPKASAQAIRARAAHLPEAARQLAHAAAVLRAPLPPDAGAALLGGQPAQWVEPYALLEAAQWVDARGVMHDLVSAALREAMPGAERRWLHGNVARWLVQAGSSGQAVAGHFEEAGLLQEAAEQLEAAALRAHRASRPAEEAELWERAASLWERTGRRERVFEALRMSVTPRFFASGNDLALAAAKRLVESACTPREEAIAKLSLGELLGRLHRRADSLPVLTQARSGAAAANDAVNLLRATVELAHCLAWLDRPDESLAMLQEVEPSLSQCEFQERQAYLTCLGTIHFRRYRFRDAASTCRERMALAEERGDWRYATVAASNLAVVLTESGWLEDAYEASERALCNLQRLGPVGGQDLVFIEIAHARICACMGAIGEALRSMERGLGYLRAPGTSPVQRVHLCWCLTVCHLLRGDAVSAQSQLLKLPEDDFTRAGEQKRRILLQAVIAAAQGQDPSSWLRQARDLAAGSPHKSSVDIDATEVWCGIGCDDPQGLLALEQRARATEQGGLATRLAWYRVDALRRCGEAAAAAARARELLDQPLRPTMLLPCHWLWIAQAAFAAAGDPQAPAVAARARQAHAKTLADLGELSGPPAQWPGPMTGWRSPEAG
jgi:DNA-binding SARP family transcriptional activator